MHKGTKHICIESLKRSQNNRGFVKRFQLNEIPFATCVGWHEADSYKSGGVLISECVYSTDEQTDKQTGFCGALPEAAPASSTSAALLLVAKKFGFNARS